MRHQLSILIMISIFAATAFAATYPNYVMINVSETVYENTTFAENFDLTESVKECYILGEINISNPSAHTVGDTYINFTNTVSMITNMTYQAGRNGSQNGNRSPGANWSLHIPELLSGESTLWTYNLSCSQTPSPVNLSTTYDSGLGGLSKKVLAGRNFTVTKWVSNEFSSASLRNVNILMEAKAVTWNATLFNFSFINLSYASDSDSGNVTISDNWTWNWQPAGGTIAGNAQYNISYFVQTPDNVPTSNTYLFMQETTSFVIEELLSNLTITSVRARSDIDLSLDKQITRPAHDVNDTNVTWQAGGNITVPFDIKYQITKVSVWVSKNLSPIATDTVFGKLNNTYGSATINSTNNWDTSASPWNFNFTDGSDSVTSPPPILWIRPYYYIFGGENQILVYNVTQNGTDIYLSYIYVINGYWLQVNKNITSSGKGRYLIDIYVENVGNAYTPEDLAVTVYDFVPNEFAAGEYVPASHSPDSSSAVEGAGFNGTSYRWVIPNVAPYNASLGPGDHWNTSYYVNGTGEYKISELYIVGLDPRKVDGAGTHEGITVISNLSSYTKEVFYVIGVLALLILNVVNFVMTRRINNKLNK